MIEVKTAVCLIAIGVLCILILFVIDNMLLDMQNTGTIVERRLGLVENDMLLVKGDVIGVSSRLSGHMRLMESSSWCCAFKEGCRKYEDR